MRAGDPGIGRHETGPALAFLIPAVSPRRPVIEHLLTVLAVPQAVLVDDVAGLPRTTCAVLDVDDVADDSLPQGVTRWRLAGEGPALGRADLGGLPAERRIRSVDLSGGRVGAASRMTNQALFWLGERLEKGAGPPSAAEARAWRVVLEVLERIAGGTWEELRQRVTRRGSPEPDEAAHGVLDRKAALLAPERVVARALELLPSGLEGDGAGAVGTSGGPQDSMSADVEELRELYISMLPHCINAPRLLAVAIAARLVGDISTWDRVVGELDERWHLDGVAFPRPSLPPRTVRSLSYTPLTVAYWALRRRDEERDAGVLAQTWRGEVTTRSLVWRTVDGGRLHDPRSRLVSPSLLEHWELLHRLDLAPGHQIRLDPHIYDLDVSVLEAHWIAVLREMLAEHGQPLLRLRPWPGRKTSALSLRYDIDREIGADRIAELTKLQIEHLGTVCASWYHHPADPLRPEQARLLREHGQEPGLHLESPSHAVGGLGVTHHSAPTSDYWRGTATNRELSAAGSVYGEFLAAQVWTPRPDLASMVAEQESAGSAARTLWVTPLHFPLEGSTADTTLAYFDQLGDAFRRQLTGGGHAIIGAHPDIEPDLMRQALSERLDGDPWCATVAEVVGRCSAIQTIGNVEVGAPERGGAQLWFRSRRELADVAVEVWEPGRSASRRTTLQLVPGKLQPIP